MEISRDIDHRERYVCGRMKRGVWKDMCGYRSVDNIERER